MDSTLALLKRAAGLAVIDSTEHEELCRVARERKNAGYVVTTILAKTKGQEDVIQASLFDVLEGKPDRAWRQGQSAVTAKHPHRPSRLVKHFPGHSPERLRRSPEEDPSKHSKWVLPCHTGLTAALDGSFPIVISWPVLSHDSG